MKKAAIIIISLIVVVGAVITGLGLYKFKYTSDNTHNDKQFNSYDATYMIEGQKITLKNGVAEMDTAPGSASKIITRYFGNEVRHDFDKDGREDVVFLVTQERGGSGTFFYVVGLLNTINGPMGSDGVLLGDRIAPQTTHMGNGNVVVVNYAERNPGESFATRPSVGKSKWLLLDVKTMQFGEVAQNFEGEADPARMTLGMKTWNWVRTAYNNDTEVRPRDEKTFTLTLKSGNMFSATTDCNGVGGEYAVNGNKIIFTRMMSTLMYCENSQEGDFVKMLEGVTSYFFTGKGELVLELKYDSGTVIFK